MSQMSTCHLAGSGAVSFPRPAASHEGKEAVPIAETAQSWRDQIYLSGVQGSVAKVSAPLRGKNGWGGRHFCDRTIYISIMGYETSKLFTSDTDLEAL